LSGNGGNNILGGAAGADTLFGGGGADTFVVTNDKTFDQIIDFVSGEDKIALSGRAFRSLFISGNQLKEGVFGEKLKLDVDGGLWFDSDGSGRKAAVKVATIGVTASLEMDDFVFLA
jgi:Ca2+-binding RTX toxin-like protein